MHPGGYGTVYRARRKVDGRIFAIKCMCCIDLLLFCSSSMRFSSSLHAWICLNRLILCNGASDNNPIVKKKKTKYITITLFTSGL